MPDNGATPTVLITGASRGIGRATALHTAEAGWHVYAGVRNADVGVSLARESPRITPVDLDITVPAHVARLDEALPPRLDAVVNNAGIAVGGPIEAVSLNDLRWQFEVNLVGQVAVTQAVLPRLRRSRGRVVFVSSLNGRVSIPMSGPYNASKYALEGLADALRVELRPWGIRVILIEPGCIDTDPWRGMLDLLDQVADAMPPEQRHLYAAHLAGQRRICAKLQQQTKPTATVARAIERALTSRRPRPRHLVGPDAHALVAMRAALPTRLLDAVWARGLGLHPKPNGSPTHGMPTNPDQGATMNENTSMMSPTASRVFGLATIAAPLLLLGSTIAYATEDGINDGVVGGMIGIWSTFALAVAYAGIYRMIEPRAPRIGPIFGALALVGAAAGTLFNLQAMYLAAYGNDLLTDAMDGSLPDVSTLTFLAFLPWGWLAPVSFVATGILLWRTRTVPTWSALLLILGGILFISSRPARIEPLAIACDIVLVLALVPIGWSMLARRRLVADVMPSTVSA